MGFTLKRTGIGAFLLGLVVGGRALGLSFEASGPDRHSDTDTPVWVLEPKNEPAAADDVSARSPVSFGVFDTRARRSVANRNRNPLNLKFGSDTRRYVDVGLATISEIVPTDGGRFLKFRSSETGFRAAADLLSTPGYGKLRIDRALRRWSNNAYGAEILAGTRLDAGIPVPSLRPGDLRVLLQAMAAAEGYRSSATADEIRRALEH